MQFRGQPLALHGRYGAIGVGETWRESPLGVEGSGWAVGVRGAVGRGVV